MDNITIPKVEYNDLKERSMAYERMLEAAQHTFSLTPPEKSGKVVINCFKKTGKYSQKFLSSLNRGLKRSNYFTS